MREGERGKGGEVSLKQHLYIYSWTVVRTTLDTDGGLVERSSMRSGWQRAQYRARVLGRAAVAAGRPSR